MSNAFERERDRVTRVALNNPRPCAVCKGTHVVTIGTWIPDHRFRLAAGGTDHSTPVFAFWLCFTHAEPSEENNTLIRQAVLRSVRTNKNHYV